MSDVFLRFYDEETHHQCSFCKEENPEKNYNLGYFVSPNADTHHYYLPFCSNSCRARWLLIQQAMFADMNSMVTTLLDHHKPKENV